MSTHVAPAAERPATSGDLDTLPKHLLAAEEGPRAELVAFRQKHLGCWVPTTWKQYTENVRATFMALSSLGLGEGDAVAMIAENCPEWLYVDLATQSARGFMAAMFAESTEPEIRYVIEHTGARVIIVGDQEQADKVLPLDDLRLTHIIVVDPRGMELYGDPRVVRFAELLQRGHELVAQQDGRRVFAEAVARTTSSDVAALLYTSGTTGKPKGALLSQHTATSAGAAIREVEGLTPDEELISYLPFAWVGERMFSVFYHLVVGYRINFPEDLEMAVVLANWREVQPTFVLAPPRIWEQLTSRVYIGIDNTTRLKRRFFTTLMPVAQRVGEAKLAGRRSPLRDRVLWRVGDVLLYRWIRERLGLLNAHVALTGGAALGPEVISFFHGLGVDLRQVYGQSECAGIAVIQRKGESRAETVGRPLPGVEVRIADNGEVQLRGDLVFDRYLNNPEATQSAFDDGWLHTGDQGFLAEDGQLGIVDRMKDVCVTTAGDSFSPQLLENKLKFSRFIRDAIVVGNDKPYVGALLQIDYDNVGNWAQRHGLTYTTFRDLSSNDAVRSLIDDEVRAVSRTLPGGLQIQRFHLLDKELDADDEEITRTTKIKRPVIERKYAQHIAELYEAAPAARPEASV